MSAQLTREQAIEFAEAGKWEAMSFRERAEFQLEQDLMCMPFDKFHEAVERTLDRSVWTHEFADRDRLRDELAGKRPKATMDEVFGSLARLASDKPVVIVKLDGSPS